MITCTYCQISYEKFQPRCSGCGAVLEGAKSAYADDKNLPAIERIKHLCAYYGESFPSVFANEIPSSKIEWTERSFRKFPTAKEIFLFCDTTLRKSAIWGIIFAEDGIYWKNEDTTPTKKNYLSWDEYTKESLRPQRTALELDNGNVISLAGIIKYEDRKKVFQFFKELKNLLAKEQKSDQNDNNNNSLPPDEKVRQLCLDYEDAKEFRPLSAISAKKLRTAKKHFNIFPSEENILLFCDTTPLDKGKRGFIVCKDGLYWHNNWANETNRNYLAWEDFAKRDLKLKSFALDLGRRETIRLAGLGSDLKREKALDLLTKIRNTLKA